MEISFSLSIGCYLVKMEKVSFYFMIFAFFIWRVSSRPTGDIDDIYDIDSEVEECWEDEDYVEEYGDLFEGDMDLNNDQLTEIFGDGNVTTGDKYRWPNAVVPYQLSAEHSKEGNELILAVMKEIEKVSCVRFRQRTNETDYVQFEANDKGCFSSVGHLGGRQHLNLKKSEMNEGCFRFGPILHQLLHTLGFYHMQSASDRDSYVKINWENIIENKTDNFRKYKSSFEPNFNVKYDIGSIMHYSGYAFSKNIFQLTIQPIGDSSDDWAVMGQREMMSEMDILKLNAKYQCKANTKNSVTKPRTKLQTGFGFSIRLAFPFTSYLYRIFTNLILTAIKL